MTTFTNAAPPIDVYSIRTPSGSPPPWSIPDMPNRVNPKFLLQSSTSDRVLVFVSVGQSNAANMSLGYTYTSHNQGKVFQLNPEDGALYYQLADPLVGATGNGGHWTLDMADRLIDAGVYDYVVLVGITAIGGASVEYFTPTVFGTLKHRLLVAGHRLKDLGLRPSCWNFALGESADGYSESQFRTPLDQMINYTRANGFTEPWIMDISTRNTISIGGTNPGAVAALQNIVNNVDILPGVDTDDLTYPAYRIDEGGARVHLNALGCQTKALRKLTNITTLKPKLANPFR